MAEESLHHRSAPNAPNCAVVRNAVTVDGPLEQLVVGVEADPTPEKLRQHPVVDLGGRLIARRLAEPHVHLDRAFSLSVTGWNRTGTLNEAIHRFRNALSDMTVGGLSDGARRALKLLSAAGVGHVRTHTACGASLDFRAWEAVETAAAHFPDVSVEQVVMPLGGILGNPDAIPVVREAAARGAVALGGAPWRAEDPANATRLYAQVAADLGIGLDLHVDESDDPSLSTLGALAAAAIETGLAGKTFATHCCSMAGRPGAVARREAELLAEARVAVILCPVSSLSLHGRTSGLRGVAPVRVLREAGVAIGIGLDNIRDVVVGVGTADPVRAGWLLSLAAHLTGEDDLEWLGSRILMGNREILGLDAWPSPPNADDLLVFEAKTAAEVVALVAERWRLSLAADLSGSAPDALGSQPGVL